MVNGPLTKAACQTGTINGLFCQFAPPRPAVCGAAFLNLREIFPAARFTPRSRTSDSLRKPAEINHLAIGLNGTRRLSGLRAMERRPLALESQGALPHAVGNKPGLSSRNRFLSGLFPVRANV